jgi:alpha-glucosidase
MNSTEVREVARLHRENQIPLDSIYLDIDYMEAYKDFTIDREAFPDFEALVEEMRSQGIRLVPIIDAGVKIEEGYPVYEEGREKGYFCKDQDGKDFIVGVCPPSGISLS